MAVFVLDRRKKPLMPCSEKRARLLLKRGRARVAKLSPFTIRLLDRTVEQSILQPIAVTIDPGSKATGIAVSRESTTSNGAKRRHILALFEIQHRGQAISKNLTARAAFRRRRRGANLRYRAPRFDNRTRAEGWLAPSLQHRVDNIGTWTIRLGTLAPITRIAVEQVRFDMQLIENASISGIEYQQGTLFQYEIREYVLEKWNRICAYCDERNAPLEIEHIVPKSRGGSNRPSNLTLACVPCNEAKGSRPVEDFVTDPKRLRRILTNATAPLRDAAAVNTTRLAIVATLAETAGLPIETGTGGRTKFNRLRFRIPKSHSLDAACVGEVDDVIGWKRPTLVLTATGRGTYQRARLDRYGLPRGHSTRTKRIHGFATGDHIRAVVPSGKKTGTYVGRVAIRATGSFNIQTAGAVVQGISHRRCSMLQRADGYGRKCMPSQNALLPAVNGGVCALRERR